MVAESESIYSNLSKCNNNIINGKIYYATVAQKF